MDDLTSEFVAETRETLERVGASLVAWEANPADAARLDEIFRFVHTVKGSCGFLDFGRIGALAHAAESALAEVRDGKRAATPALVGAMLRLIDRIALLSDALESGADVPDEAGDATLIAALDGQSEIPVVAEPAQRGARSIRVAVDLLEALMNQVSDLVLARNDLARRLREGDDSELALERLSATVADVRDSVTRTRMQPIEKLFATLPRLARDTAAATGKDVHLEIEGGDVEIDREMVELIRDPLTHIVRNAIDHGIEAPEVRRAAGKASAGTLRIAARQSGNQVSIEIDDDGRGVDIAALKAGAIAAKLIDADAAGVLSDEAALQLMFAPGLSTATEVTAVSGRGVGMDVARDNVERLGGTIALANRPGRGLTITLRAPLTLSIMSAIVIEAGGQMFAVPRAAIEEIVAADSAAVRVERVGDGRLAVVRGALLTVVPLGGALGLDDADPVRLVIVDPPGGRRFALGV
ncbi:MAG: Hpt domain-containing protein, partial [Sphingomonadaceae bacterium]|nr:Hpt domain-containing protein [Sphingomonadaceae bacterium]